MLLRVVQLLVFGPDPDPVQRVPEQREAKVFQPSRVGRPALLNEKDYSFITSLGRKGGSPVAAAIVNALIRLAKESEG